MIVFFLNVKTFNDFSGQNLQFVQIIIFMESPHNILKSRLCVCYKMRKSYWSKSSSWFPSLLWKQSFWKILCSLHTKHYAHEIRVSHSDGSLQVQLVTELMSDLIGRRVLIKPSMIHLQALFSTWLVGGADGYVRWEWGQNHIVAGKTKRSEVKSSKK